MPFTIITSGHSLTTIRQASLEITHEGWFIGKEYKVVGRTKPVVAFGTGLDYKKFELKIRVLSRAEYDAVMGILRNGTTITVTTHQTDVYSVAVIGPIQTNSVLASPFAGEPYSTRFAWDITCQVSEV